MRTITRAAVVGLGLTLAVTAAACSDDDEATDTTEAPGTTQAPGTTVPVPTAEVTADFDGEVDEEAAEQAAETMQRRITTYLELQGESADGVEVTVDDAGTGLVIIVPGTDDEAAAAEVVQELAFRGDLYFRPGLAQYPPEPGGTLVPPDAVPADDDATDDTAVETTTTTTTAPSATIPEATAPDADDPTGTSVLVWRDVETIEQLQDPTTAEALALWEVGPSALEGSAVEDSELTTLGGDPAVKVVLTEGADGLDAFNGLAEGCFDRADTCPTGAYTVTFDGAIVVASIPRPNDAEFRPFTQDDVIIYSSEWSEDVARTLAIAFEAGALPVPLTVTS